MVTSNIAVVIYNVCFGLVEELSDYSVFWYFVLVNVDDMNKKCIIVICIVIIVRI